MGAPCCTMLCWMQSFGYSGYSIWPCCCRIISHSPRECWPTLNAGYSREPTGPHGALHGVRYERKHYGAPWEEGVTQ
jgi:hypothetical protein